MNRDFIGQGAGNAASAVFGGMPIGASLSSTALNVQLGGRHRIANFIIGPIIAVVLLLLAPLVELIPMAALAAMLVLIGVRAIDVPAMRAVWQTSLPDPRHHARHVRRDAPRTGAVRGPARRGALGRPVRLQRFARHPRGRARARCRGQVRRGGVARGASRSIAHRPGRVWQRVLRGDGRHRSPAPRRGRRGGRRRGAPAAWPGGRREHIPGPRSSDTPDSSKMGAGILPSSASGQRFSTSSPAPAWPTPSAANTSTWPSPPSWQRSTRPSRTPRPGSTRASTAPPESHGAPERSSTEARDPMASVVVFSLLLLGYAAVSRRLERVWVTSAMVFVLAGALLGPAGLDVLHLSLESEILEASRRGRSRGRALQRCRSHRPQGTPLGPLSAGATAGHRASAHDRSWALLAAAPLSPGR